MRRRLATTATTAAAVLAGVSVLAGGGAAASADEVPVGPVLAFAGYDGDQGRALLAVDTVSGRQWTVAEGFAHDATWSPDGTHIAWLAYDEDYLGHVQVADADGGGREQVEGGGDSRSLTWGPDGTLAWLHRSAWNPTDCTTDDRLVRPDLVLQAPDGTRRTLGTAAPTASDLTSSPDGRTVAWYEQGGDPCGQAVAQLVLTDVASGTRSVVAEGTYGIAFSPDSSTIAATRTTSEESDVVLVDVASRTARQVATPGVGERYPQFVRDGSALAVQRTVGTEDRFALVGLDGSPLQDVARAPDLVEEIVASTDGTSLLIAGSTVFPTESDDMAVAEPGIWRQPLDGSPAVKLSDDGWLGSGELDVASWSSPAPVVVRDTRRPR